MWSSFCLLCVLLFTHPFGCQGNSDAASGGASGSVNAESFQAMVVQCVAGAGGLVGWHRGVGEGAMWGGKKEALLLAHWTMLVRMPLLIQSL